MHEIKRLVHFGKIQIMGLLDNMLLIHPSIFNRYISTTQVAHLDINGGLVQTCHGNLHRSPWSFI